MAEQQLRLVFSPVQVSVAVAVAVAFFSPVLAQLQQLLPALVLVPQMQVSQLASCLTLPKYPSAISFVLTGAIF